MLRHVPTTIALALLAPSACSGDPSESPSEASGPASASGAGAGGQGGSGGGGAGGGVPCDDSKPDPGTNPAGTCDNLGPVCAPYCKTAVGALKPAVAYSTITCLAVETECDKSGIDCMLKALADVACSDPSADDDCESVGMLCGNAAGGGACHALLDGIIEAARAAAISCAEQACTGSLEPCVRSVLTPPST